MRIQGFCSGSIQRDELPRRRMLLPTTTRSPQPYGFFIIIFGSSPTGKNFFAFFQAKTKALTPAYAKIIYIQKLSTIEKEIITEWMRGCSRWWTTGGLERATLPMVAAVPGVVVMMLTRADDIARGVRTVLLQFNLIEFDANPLIRSVCWITKIWGFPLRHKSIVNYFFFFDSHDRKLKSHFSRCHSLSHKTDYME